MVRKIDARPMRQGPKNKMPAPPAKQNLPTPSTMSWRQARRMKGARDMIHFGFLQNPFRSVTNFAHHRFHPLSSYYP